MPCLKARMAKVAGQVVSEGVAAGQVVPAGDVVAEQVVSDGDVAEEVVPADKQPETRGETITNALLTHY